MSLFCCLLVFLLFYIKIFHCLVSLVHVRKHKKYTPVVVKLVYLQTKKIRNQIVENLPKPNKIKPKRAKFLSEEDNSVEKESINRSKQISDGGTPKGSPEIIREEGIIDLGKINLFPDSVIGKIAGSSPGRVSDALHGLEDGDATLFNTFATKYASYFNRIKKQVSKRWHPIEELRWRDPKRNIFGWKPRRTTLRITLDSKGKILYVEVKRRSGVTFLDALAVDAFKQCKSFPSPPSRAIKNGRIVFDFWFLVETTPPLKGGWRIRIK